MSCTEIRTGVIVCGPNPTNYRKRYWRCSTCQCITEQVALYELWHGMSRRCCRCGEHWDEEGGTWRPFAPGWRKAAVRRARELWDIATFGPPPSFDAELDYLESSWGDYVVPSVVTVELPPMPGEEP